MATFLSSPPMAVAAAPRRSLNDSMSFRLQSEFGQDYELRVADAMKGLFSPTAFELDTSYVNSILSYLLQVLESRGTHRDAWSALENLSISPSRKFEFQADIRFLSRVDFEADNA